MKAKTTYLWTRFLFVRHQAQENVRSDIRMRPGSSKTAVRAISAGRARKSIVENTSLNGRDWTKLATLQAGVTGRSDQKLQRWWKLCPIAGCPDLR